MGCQEGSPDTWNITPVVPFVYPGRHKKGFQNFSWKPQVVTIEENLGQGE